MPRLDGERGNELVSETVECDQNAACRHGRATPGWLEANTKVRIKGWGRQTFSKCGTEESPSADPGNLKPCAVECSWQ